MALAFLMGNQKYLTKKEGVNVDGISFRMERMGQTRPKVGEEYYMFQEPKECQLPLNIPAGRLYITFGDFLRGTKVGFKKQMDTENDDDPGAYGQK